MKQLVQLQINPEIYDKILKIKEGRIDFVKDINEYRNGYEDKKRVKCVIDKYIITTGEILDYVINCNIDDDNYILNNKAKPCQFVGWKQYVCVVVKELDKCTAPDFAPHICKKIIHDKLHKLGFTDEDIDNRLNMYQAEYDPRLIQVHYSNTERNKILKFTNCYYYDINKAHSDALGEIFPELRTWLQNIAKLARKDKKWKSVPNYYVGMLAYKTSKMKREHRPGKYEKTYNWIVQRTTKMVEDFINEIGAYDSDMVYINTDGFVINNPLRTPESSKEFGKFKLESDERVFYTYKGDNYEIIQYGDTIKGSLPVSLRKYVDLREGRVVSYKIKEIDGIRTAINVNVEVIK